MNSLLAFFARNFAGILALLTHRRGDMIITEKLIPAGHPNRPGVKMKDVRAIVVHYTANDAPGATDTANATYFGRKYLPSTDGPMEADGVTPFRFGSAQVIADADSVTLALPEDEVSWGCGDRHITYEPVYKGQQPLARHIFGNNQNYHTVNVEICNNDTLRDTDEDWYRATQNAMEWIQGYCKRRKVKIDVEGALNPQTVKSVSPGSILIVRHFDLTGKICPKPFLDDPQAWEIFVRITAKGIV